MTFPKTKLPAPNMERSEQAYPSVAWLICRSLLGVVLLTAAVLKAEELAALPMLGPGLLNERWLLACVVEVEAVLGCWLLLGAGGFMTWAITLIMWLAFLGVAGYEVVSGVESCGCFGRVEINPWYTAVFDLIVVLVLPFCRPVRGTVNNGEGARFFAVRMATVGLICMAGAAFGVWNLYRYSAGRLSEDGLSFADQTVILEPEKWVGHPFILADYIDVGPQLTHGDWIVLLYRYDCEHCQQAVPRYAVLAQQKRAVDSPSVALVEIPPFAPPGQELIRPSTSIVRGQLSEKHDWFASTPVMIRIHNGTVRTVAESDAAEHP